MAGQTNNSPRTGRWMRIRVSSRRRGGRKLWSDLTPEDRLTVAETSDGVSDWKDTEPAVKSTSAKGHGVIALIDSWLNVDKEEEQEQKETYQFLKTALKEHAV